jgi:hypothetical protein
LNPSTNTEAAPSSSTAQPPYRVIQVQPAS